MRHLLFILLYSCTLLPYSSREREIQTDIVVNIREKSPQFAKCIKSNNLFSKFQKERIRLVVFLAIDSKGHIEKFQLDDKKYPNEFSECIFKVVDSVSFPKIKNNELIELEQPFIFSKK